MRVSPTASVPKISARCEIDLSPGDADAALERPRAARGQRLQHGVIHGQSLGWDVRPS